MDAAGRTGAGPADAADARELVALLGLAASQIEVALRESEAPVATLGAGVGELEGAAAALDEALGAVPADAAPLRAALQSRRDALRGRARDAAVALQFHDRLVQRLVHVRDGLAALGAFVDERRHREPGADWDGLRRHIRARYSMEQERVMFDLLVAGASPEQVLDALADLRHHGNPGHVDLF